MTSILNAFWSELNSIVNYHKKDDDALILNDKFNEFIMTATDMYNSMKNSYMKESVTTLDRHKVAAVMIASSVECNVVSYNRSLNKFVFLGNEMFSTEVALDWMLTSMNDKLKSNGFKGMVAEYYIPDPFACRTPYFEIFCRSLYYAKQRSLLNPLDIAEKLFLIEHLTLMKERIDPKYLCEKIEAARKLRFLNLV